MPDTTTHVSPYDWYGWTLNPDGPALVYVTRGHPYHVSLDELLTSAGVLFWIVQIFHKPWGDPAFRGFVTAVDDLLDPHTTMNPAGGPGFTPESLRERVAEFVRKGR